MEVTTKIKAIIKDSSLTKLFLFGFSIYAIIVFLFGIIYFFGGNLKTEKLEVKEFGDCIYFSFISFLTIGYGDIAPSTGWSKFFLFLESIFSIGFTATFSAVIAYQLLKRPNDILISKKIYLRKSNKLGHSGHRNHDLMIRVGNKGDALIDCKGVLEFFVIKNNTRTNVLKFSRDYRVIELTWNFKMRYFEPENGSTQIYKGELQNFFFNNIEEPKQIRFSVSGTDGKTGQLVAASIIYKVADLTFISSMVNVYNFEGTDSTTPDWNKFDHFNPMTEEDIQRAKSNY